MKIKVYYKTLAKISGFTVNHMYKFDSCIDRSPDYPDTPDEKISKQEQIRMIHLRSHLNELTEKVKHHQYLTEKTR